MHFDLDFEWEQIFAEETAMRPNCASPRVLYGYYAENVASANVGRGHERPWQGKAATDTGRRPGEAGRVGSAVGHGLFLQRSRRRGPLLAASPEHECWRSGEHAPRGTRGPG